MPTHLLSNGHLRCGVHPGHISQRLWPGELRVTANPEATNCPGCRSRAGLPPIEVSNDLAQVVETLKEGMRGNTAADRLAEALMGSVTLAEVESLSHEVFLEMQKGCSDIVPSA